MRLTSRLVSLISRRTLWAEGHVFAVSPEQLGIAEGVRAALTMAIMLAGAVFLHMPDLAYGAAAAFWTCLCDPQGSDMRRLKGMGAFTLLGLVAITLSSYLAHFGLIAGSATLFLLVFACSLTRFYNPAFGPTPAQAGLIASIAVVIGVASPRAALPALQLGGAFLLGAVLAILICIFLWRIPPRNLPRRTIVALYGRLHDMAAYLETLDTAPAAEPHAWEQLDTVYRRAVRISIERAREIAARAAITEGYFSQRVDAAGRVFAALVALGHYRHGLPDTFDPVTERPLLAALSRLLQAVAHQADRTEPDMDAVLALASDLQLQAGNGQGAVARAVLLAANAVAEAVRRAADRDTAERAAAAAYRPLNFSVDAFVWRHALRVSAAVLAVYVIGVFYHVSLSYWGAIAALVVMQPLSDNTSLRIIERAFGSIVGGSIAAILLETLDQPLERLVVIIPLAAVVIALRMVNYGLFVVFLTPMFMLLSDYIRPADGLVAARVVNELIGAGIGVAASLLLWPERQGQALAAAITAAVTANLAFASAVLRRTTTAPDDLDRLQREAGLASTRLETTRERMVLNGFYRQRRLDRLHDIATASRTVCGATLVLEISRGPADGDAARADRIDALAVALRSALGDASAGAMVSANGDDDLGRAVQGLAQAVQNYARQGRGVR